MESKLENLQKQVSLLKEENKNLKHKLKCKYMDKKNKCLLYACNSYHNFYRNWICVQFSV